MKKAQTIVEYTILVILFTILCIGATALFNRNAIINGGTFGVEADHKVHVPAVQD